jgi:hypothetical protein
VSEPSLPEKIVAIDDRLRRARVPHAFGGALALAYYAEPRATIDIDVNVFTPPEEDAEVLAALTPLGVDDRGGDPAAVERAGQCRWWWGRTPIDLFFAYDALHDEMRDAIHTVPFGEDRIPILAPEHLVVCKAIFDRPKDWLDIEQILATGERLDHEEIREWLRRIAGADDPRAERFEELARRSSS